MTQLHLPFLELAILIPLLGSAWLLKVREPAVAQTRSTIIMVATFLSTVGAWLDLYALHAPEAHDRWDLLSTWLGPEFPVVDELSAPLLPLAALLYLLTTGATLRTKVRRFSFGGNLLSLSILLATLSCREPWILAALLVAGAIPPYLELRNRRKPVRIYVLHMGLLSVCLAAGAAMLEFGHAAPHWQAWGAGFLMLAVLIRSGIFPFHCWLTDLFEHATFGTALLQGTPIVGAYVYVRVVFPYAPQWQVDLLGYMAIFTAVYGGGMALVQREARRFFCFLLVSHTAIVLLGLQIATPHSVTGALCVWLSVALALSGFGLTLRSIESREGRLSLVGYHGLYDHVPTLAAFFLLTGLASVGFPGTFGFVGTEMLVDGVVQAYPHAGIGVVIATTLTGIAVLKTYFRIFTGKHHVTTISLRRRPAERFAVLALGTVILGGGILPQPGIASRHHAALEILEHRRQLSDAKSTAFDHHSTPALDVSQHSTPAVERPSDTATSAVLKYSR